MEAGVMRSRSTRSSTLIEDRHMNTNHRRSISKVLAGVLVALASVASAAPADIRAIAVQGNTGSLFSAASPSLPTGTWLYTVAIPSPGSADFVFQGTETYTLDGGYSEADQLSFTPGYLATPGHGAWASASAHTFLLTYMNLTYDASGNATGTGRVRQRATLDHSGNTYQGAGDFYYYDMTGAVVFNGTFTITAVRIGVEAPQ
jgi:hypothetical protein